MSHRPKHLRKILDDAQRIAAAHGFTISLETAGCHPKLVIEGRGHRRVTPLSSSPSDADRHRRFKRADVKKLCKEMCA